MQFIYIIYMQFTKFIYSLYTHKSDTRLHLQVNVAILLYKYLNMF